MVLGLICGVCSCSGQTKNQTKIACVGDSVTYGYGLRNWQETNYPAVLQKLLGSDYKVMNFGENGDCVQETSDQPYTTSLSYVNSLDFKADIVVFMMGSNDSKVENWQGKEHFRDSYCKLIDQYEGSKIILCTPATAYYVNYWGEIVTKDDDGITSFAIQPEVIKEMSDVVKEIARERGYKVVDVNSITANHPEWFTLDGTHPNEDGAEAIAEAVYDCLVG